MTGSTGIAAASAELFARRAPRCSSRRGRRTTPGAGGRGSPGAAGSVAGRPADLTEQAQVEAVVADCVARFGRVDGLFSVAGGSGRRFGDGPIDELDAEAWDATLALNLRTQALVCRSVVRQMRAQEPNDSGTRGSILLMGSVTSTTPSRSCSGRTPTPRRRARSTR